MEIVAQYYIFKSGVTRAMMSSLHLILPTTSR